MSNYAINIIEKKKELDVAKEGNIYYLFNNSNIDTASEIETERFGTKNKPLTSRGIPKAQVASPIKTEEDIKRISNYFLTTGSIEWIRLRNYMMFIIGINTGLRISDILSLKIEDVCTNGEINSEVIIYEQKTGKYHKIKLNSICQEAIDKYLSCIKEFYTDDYLFKSLKGEMLDTRSAHKILKNMSRDLELDYNVGTHTLRKTFAYWTIKLHSDEGDVLTALQKLLNHSDQRVTFSYANIDEDKLNSIYDDLGEYLF